MFQKIEEFHRILKAMRVSDQKNVSPLDDIVFFISLAP
jgi:hypothetical protein